MLTGEKSNTGKQSVAAPLLDPIEKRAVGIVNRFLSAKPIKALVSGVMYRQIMQDIHALLDSPDKATIIDEMLQQNSKYIAVVYDLAVNQTTRDIENVKRKNAKENVKKVLEAIKQTNSTPLLEQDNVQRTNTLSFSLNSTIAEVEVSMEDFFALPDLATVQELAVALRKAGVNTNAKLNDLTPDFNSLALLQFTFALYAHELVEQTEAAKQARKHRFDNNREKLLPLQEHSLEAVNQYFNEQKTLLLLSEYITEFYTQEYLTQAITNYYNFKLKALYPTDTVMVNHKLIAADTVASTSSKDELSASSEKPLISSADQLKPRIAFKSPSKIEFTATAELSIEKKQTGMKESIGLVASSLQTQLIVDRIKTVPMAHFTIAAKVKEEVSNSVKVKGQQLNLITLISIVNAMKDRGVIVFADKIEAIQLNELDALFNEQTSALDELCQLREGDNTGAKEFKAYVKGLLLSITSAYSALDKDDRFIAHELLYYLTKLAESNLAQGRFDRLSFNVEAYKRLTRSLQKTSLKLNSATWQARWSRLPHEIEYRNTSTTFAESNHASVFNLIQDLKYKYPDQTGILAAILERVNNLSSNSINAANKPKMIRELELLALRLAVEFMNIPLARQQAADLASSLKIFCDAQMWQLQAILISADQSESDHTIEIKAQTEQLAGNINQLRCNQAINAELIKKFNEINSPLISHFTHEVLQCIFDCQKEDSTPELRLSAAHRLNHYALAITKDNTLSTNLANIAADSIAKAYEKFEQNTGEGFNRPISPVNDLTYAEKANLNAAIQQPYLRVVAQLGELLTLIEEDKANYSPADQAKVKQITANVAIIKNSAAVSENRTAAIAATLNLIKDLTSQTKHTETSGKQLETLGKVIMSGACFFFAIPILGMVPAIMGLRFGREFINAGAKKQDQAQKQREHIETVTNLIKPVCQAVLQEIYPQASSVAVAVNVAAPPEKSMQVASAATIAATQPSPSSPSATTISSSHSQARPKISCGFDEMLAAAQANVAVQQSRNTRLSVQTLKNNSKHDEYGLAIRDVAGTGNCLFEAVAVSMREEASCSGLELRKAALEHIAAHKENFIGFVEDNKNIDAYIAEMRDPGKWGGSLEIEALARVYNKTIVVLKPQAGLPPQIHNAEACQKGVIFLRHVNINNHQAHEANHYVAGLPVSKEHGLQVVQLLQSQSIVKAHLQALVRNPHKMPLSQDDIAHLDALNGNLNLIEDPQYQEKLQEILSKIMRSSPGNLNVKRDLAALQAAVHTFELALASVKKAIQGLPQQTQTIDNELHKHASPKAGRQDALLLTPGSTISRTMKSTKRQGLAPSIR